MKINFFWFFLYFNVTIRNLKVYDCLWACILSLTGSTGLGYLPSMKQVIRNVGVLRAFQSQVRKFVTILFISLIHPF